MRAIWILGPALIGLTACDLETGASKADSGNGTSVSINAGTESGDPVKIAADGQTGQVAIKLPGVDAKVKLPKMMLDNSNFDIDGVSLYPGSKIQSLNVDAQSGSTDQANVQIAFTAPGDVAKVRDWFAKAFADKAVTARQVGETLVGTTKDGDRFTMSFAPGAAGGTAGRIQITDAQK